MKNLILLSILLISSIPSAWGAPKCRDKFVETTTEKPVQRRLVLIDDNTPAQAKGAGFWVNLINSISEPLRPVSDGRINDSALNEYTQIKSRYQSHLAKAASDHFENFQFRLAEQGSSQLRKKIDLILQNEKALYTAGYTNQEPDLNFIQKLLILKGDTEAERKSFFSARFNVDLKNRGILAREPVIELAWQQYNNKETPLVLKMVQNSKDSVLLVTNDLSLEATAGVLISDSHAYGLTVYKIDFSSYSQNELAPDIVFGNHKYRLEINRKRGAVSAVYTPRSKPDTKQMWADRELNGVILIDATFADDPWLKDEYVSYYRSQGFRFEKNARLSTMQEIFAKPFVTGKIDYVAAEHNESPQMSGEVQVLVGTKNTKQGVERIQIISSKKSLREEGADYEPSFILSNTQWAELLKERKKNKVASEIIYLNTKCFSICDIHKISNWVNSKDFVYIGPEYIAETFSNTDTSPLVAILNGIRAGTPYRRIHAQAVQAQKLNSKENFDRTDIEENDYVFPSMYANSVRINYPQKIQNNVTFEARLVKSSNRKQVPIEVIDMDPE